MIGESLESLKPEILKLSCIRFGDESAGELLKKKINEIHSKQLKIKEIFVCNNFFFKSSNSILFFFKEYILHYEVFVIDCNHIFLCI